MRDEYYQSVNETKIIKRKEVKTLIEPYLLNILNYIIVEHKSEQQSKRIEILHTILNFYPNVMNTPDSNGNFLFEHIMNIVPKILEINSTTQNKKSNT